MPLLLSPDQPQIETLPDIAEQYKPAFALQQPHRVIIHNDDVTTFEFVIAVLVMIFKQTNGRANDIAMEAHTTGLAYVCSLPAAEARKRVNSAHELARANLYPLRFTIEPASRAN